MAGTTVLDPRGANRIRNIVPHLTVLLRRAAANAEFDDDGLRPSKGIGAAILLSMLVWLPLLLILR